MKTLLTVGLLLISALARAGNPNNPDYVIILGVPSFSCTNCSSDGAAAAVSTQNVGGTVTANQGTSPWVIVQSSQASQTINGTVTANQGTSPWVIVQSSQASQVVAQAAGVPWVIVQSSQASQTINGTVTANQGTSPWVIVQSSQASQVVAQAAGVPWVIVQSSQASQTINGTVTANQGTSPWVIVQSSQASQTINGTVTANQGTSPWVIVQSSQASQVVAQAAGVPWVIVQSSQASQTINGTVTANQGTSPWVIVQSSQATQNVSGTVTANQGTSPWVIVQSSQATQNVSGTVTANQGTSPWVIVQSSQANQTISGTVTANLAAGSNNIGTVWANLISTFSAPNPGWVQISSGANGQGVSVSTPGARAPTAYMLNTQDAKDSGRLLYIATGSFTGALTEGMVTMAPIKGGVGGASGTSFGVTAGRTLRLTSWTCTWRNNTAAAGGVTCYLRHSSGSTALGSPVIDVLNATTTLATVGSGASAVGIFPDGIELTGSQTFGVSATAVGAVVGASVTVRGLEY